MSIRQKNPWGFELDIELGLIGHMKRALCTIFLENSRWTSKRFHRWTLITVFSVACFWSTAAPCAEDSKTSCEVTCKALEIAERIRGVKSTKNIPCDLSSREEIEAFIRDNIKTKVPHEKVRREEIVYKAIGLIPESYNYEKGIIDLYMNQIGGYYDPDTGRFVMANWIPDQMQMGVAVHELTHALQDQQFNLNRIMDPTLENGDEVLARSSLVEGDASAVMIDFMNEAVGSELLKSERDVEPMVMAQLEAIATPTNDREPPASVQKIVVFPYTFGLRFVNVLSRTEGFSSVDKAFRRLPRSSEEILHPDIYLSGKTSFEYLKPEDLSIYLKEVHIPVSTLPIYTDTIGEFPISALLSEYFPNKISITAAAGWGGDLLGLYDVPTRDRLAVIWRTKWDTETDAKEFYDLYRRTLQKAGNTKVEFHEFGKLSETREAKLQRSRNDVVIWLEIARS